MSLINGLDLDEGAFVGFAFNLSLADLKNDIVRRVISYEACISEAVNMVFRAKVIWIDEATPQADNADANAIWIFFFSFILCQWLIPNSALRLGTGCLIISTIFCVSLDEGFAGIGHSSENFVLRHAL